MKAWILDLDVGAVDELLVGECVVGDTDKRGKPPVANSPQPCGSPLIIDK